MHDRRPVFGTPVWIGFSLCEACAEALEHRGDLVAGRTALRRKEDLIVDLGAVDDAPSATASAIASRAQEET